MDRMMTSDGRVASERQRKDQHFSWTLKRISNKQHLNQSDFIIILHQKKQLFKVNHENVEFVISFWFVPKFIDIKCTTLKIGKHCHNKQQFFHLFFNAMNSNNNTFNLPYPNQSKFNLKIQTSTYLLLTK